MRIQAVFFDMGGTIETFGYTRALRLKAAAGLRQRLLTAGIDLGLDDDELLAAVTQGLGRYKVWSIQSMQELSPQRVWAEYVLAAYDVDLEKLNAIAEELALHVEMQFYERAMRPEVPGVLQGIQQMGLKIGMISNVNSRGQVPVNLATYGIHRYFDPVVLSSEYGRRKPDPAIFHYAARLANVPTSECVYVGDRIARDIDGARRAGFGLAVQIRHNFEHGENDEGAPPDAVIDHLDELLPILKSNSTPWAVNRHPGRLRAMIFDAGDILYYRPHRGNAFRSFIKTVFPDLEGRPPLDKERLSEKAYLGAMDQDQYHEAILRLYGITQSDQVERGREALREDENNVEFFEGVQRTLIALKERGILLGIVTNTANPVFAKLAWFERGGFGHVWDSIISSSEVGSCKPEPGIYLAALRQLGTEPGQAAFVGHDAEELEGARAAGLICIAFNYDEDAQADFFVKDFADLLKLPITSPSA